MHRDTVPAGSERLTVALIGAGAFAQFAHLPALSRRKDVRLRWVITATDQHARSVAERWGAERWSVDMNDPLTDPEVDAVDICLPITEHPDAAIAALAAGKHVLVEKPLALSVTDGVRVRDAATAARRRLMVAENWYFASTFRMAQSSIQKGMIGRPYLLRARHQSGYRIPPSNPDPGIGWLTTAGTHTISASRHLVGEFSKVFAVSPQQLAAPGRAVVETDLALTAELEPGAVGALDFTGRSRHVGERQLAFSIFGDEGLIEFDIWSGHFSESTVDGTHTRVDREPSRGFDEELDHFIACVRDDREPMPSAEDQLRTVGVIEAAYRSLTTGEPQRPWTPDQEPVPVGSAASGR